MHTTTAQRRRHDQKWRGGEHGNDETTPPIMTGSGTIPLSWQYHHPLESARENRQLADAKKFVLSIIKCYRGGGRGWLLAGEHGTVRRGTDTM